MKKLIILLTVILSITICFAQTPQAFKYQAVARDNTGNVLVNQSVALKISILKGSTSGAIVYSETHNPATNSLGLVNLEIGRGTLISGNFTSIDWGSDIYFVRIEMDATGGTNYQVMGTSQLLSVPYALYAKNTENINDADADSTNEIQVLSIMNDTLYLENGGFVDLNKYLDNSDNQLLSISNDTIVLSNGGFIKLPAVQTGSVPSNTCLNSTSITPPVDYTYSGDYFKGIGKWISKTNMPTARNRLTATAVNDKIYVIGGSNGSTVLNTVEEYDPATNTWSTKTNMPTARHSHASASINNKIYVIGGNTGSTVLNTVEEYDPATNMWSTKANMPTARYYCEAAVVNNKIYVLGGANSGASASNEEYNPSNNTWTIKASLPIARHDLNVASVNNKIYAIGGNINNSRSSSNDEYNPSTDTWSTKADLPTASGSGATVSFNNNIFIFGGSDNNGSVTNAIRIFDPSSNLWDVQTNMPSSKASMGIAIVNSKIYLIGGQDMSTTFSSTVEYTPPNTYYIHCKN